MLQKSKSKYDSGWHFCGMCGEWRRPLADGQLKCNWCGMRLRMNALRGGMKRDRVKWLE